MPSLLLAKPSCSPTCLPTCRPMRANFPFEKSKTGLGEALVAGLSASLQRPLAPLRHLWWDVAAAWYCRESHLWRHRGLVRLQEACACGRWRGPTEAQSDRLLLSSLAIELRQSAARDARRRASASLTRRRPRCTSAASSAPARPFSAARAPERYQDHKTTSAPPPPHGARLVAFAATSPVLRVPRLSLRGRASRRSTAAASARLPPWTSRRTSPAPPKTA